MTTRKTPVFPVVFIVAIILAASLKISALFPQPRQPLPDFFCRPAAQGVRCEALHADPDPKSKPWWEVWRDGECIHRDVALGVVVYLPEAKENDTVTMATRGRVRARILFAGGYTVKEARR